MQGVLDLYLLPENVVSTSNKGMSRIILWVSLFIIDTHHFFKDKTKEVMQGVLDLYLLQINEKLRLFDV